MLIKGLVTVGYIITFLGPRIYRALRHTFYTSRVYFSHCMETQSTTTNTSKLSHAESLTEKLVEKHKIRELIKDATALLPDKQENKTIKMIFYPNLTNKI